jgi:hypothetical protein
MAATKKIPLEQAAAYFDAFTKRFLRDPTPESADIEVLNPDLGDQFEAEMARVVGVTYDRKENALEIELEPEPTDHRVYHPKEIWVIEEPDGFVSSIEIIRPDDTREIVSIRHVGLQRRDWTKR